MIVFAIGCLNRGGDYSYIETMPHEWRLKGPDTEVKVYGPMPLSELKSFVRDMESSGWEVVAIDAASLPEGLMVDNTELDRPSKPTRGPWTFDIPKTMPRQDEFDPPAPKWVLPALAEFRDSIPPYLDEGVLPHRQKYLVVMRTWR